MTHLTRDDLWSLEQYSIKRPEFRKEVMAYKKNRPYRISCVGIVTWFSIA